MKKNWFNYFVYISIIFLLTTLYKSNYLIIPKIYSKVAFSASFLLLFSGLIIHSYCYLKILGISGYRVKLNSCITGSGLSVFGKYIPGKLWTVVGRAAYLADNYKMPLGKLSAISFSAEIIQYWLGLLIGLFVFLVIGGPENLIWIVLLIWFGFSILIFNSKVQNIIKSIIDRIFGKKVDNYIISASMILPILHWFLLFWILISLGFYLFVVSISSMKIPIIISAFFPIASTLGVLAIFIPGGIGVREGVLVAFLVLIEVPITIATTISVASRLWFLFGEIFLFITGYFLSKDHLIKTR